MKKKLKNIPQMPRGEGVFTWGNASRTTFKYTKVFHSEVDGTNQRVSVSAGGETDHKAKLNCIAKWEEKVNRIEEEKKKQFSISADNPETNLGKAMLDWLKRTKLDTETVKGRSYDREECTIRNQIAPYEIGKKRAQDVTQEDIQNHLHFLQYEHEKKYSYGTIKKTFEVLTQFFKWYYAKNQTLNPILLIDQPKPKKEVRAVSVEELNKRQAMPDIVLSDKEISIFKKWCYEPTEIGHAGSTKYGVALYFTLLTCLRSGEALALVWEDVDIEKRRLRINKTFSIVRVRSEGASQKTERIITTPKTESSNRFVMLSDEAIEALEFIKAHSKHTEPLDPIICTDKGSRVLEQNFSVSLKGILKASGLNKNGLRDKFGLHYLRHTGISYYIRNGVPIDVVSKMAGHANIQITQSVYYHIIEDQEIQALQIMNRIGA